MHRVSIHLFPVSTNQILLIDDEPAIADVVEYTLTEHGYVVQYAADGTLGLAAFLQAEPNLVILDLNLPGINGLELLRIIRQSHPRMPVIMLTSRADEVDRVLGLEMGADDYVTKPFSPRELATRVKAVMRRSQAPANPDEAESQSVGPLRLNRAAFTCVYFGEEVALTRAEFELLFTLVRNPARAFSRERLLDVIYNHEHAVTDRSVDALVKRVRKKLAAIRGDVEPVQTLYAVGYKIHQDLERTQ